MSVLLSNKKYNLAVSFVFALAILFFFLSNVFNDDNFIYAIGEIHTYNKNLFPNNLYIGGGMLSPRYITDILFAVIMKLNNGNWAMAALGWLYISAVIQAFAIANLAGRIAGKYQVIGAVILACMFGYIDNNLAGFSPIALQSTGTGIALAFSFLAVSYVVGKEKKYNFAWIFAACGVICHIHEGLYCCVIIFIIACAESIVHKKVLIRENWCMAIAALAILVVIIPSMITDNMNMSDRSFVDIYAVLRHPHHMVPSAWGYDTILKSLWINIVLFLISIEVIYYTKREKVKSYIIKALFLMLTWIMCLGAAYIFTEKIPIALVSTLFLSKIFKYVVIFAVIFTVNAFFKARQNKLYFSGYLILFFAFITSMLEISYIILFSIFILMAVFIENSIKSDNLFYGKSLLVADTIFLIMLLTARFNSLPRFFAIMVFAMYTLYVIVYRLGLKNGVLINVAAVFLCSCVLFVSLYGRAVYRDEYGFHILTGKQALINSLGKDVYGLALKFKDSTDADDMFIANPDDGTVDGWFQIASERNCYVIQKVIPSSKCTVGAWYDRYIQTVDIMDKDVYDIREIMDYNGIKYILVERNYFDKFDSSKQFSVFISSKDNKYKMYTVN